MAPSFPLSGLHDPQLSLRQLLKIVLHRLEALDLGINRIAFVHHEASTDLLSTYVETGTEGGPTGRDHFSGIASLDGTLRQLLKIAERRDQETATHMERVALYSRLIALQLETQRPLPADFSENLHRFAAFHDLGKVGIPDRILLKPEPLSREERLVMQGHVVIGMALIEKLITAMGLEEAPDIAVLRQVVAHHHESLDGSGYPAGLRGEAVSLAGRIVAVADIYDALTQVRPYKPAFSEPHAVQMLRSMVQAGRMDGDCVEALLSSDDQRQAIRLGHAAGAAWEGNRPPGQAGVPYDPPIPHTWVSADEHCRFP